MTERYSHFCSPQRRARWARPAFWLASAIALAACSGEVAEPSRLTCADGSTLELAPPLPPAAQQLEAAGARFDIVAAGPNNGAPVLLLQGFPESVYEYRAALPRLAKAGYRAIAAIQRSPQPSAAADRAQQALAVADALGLQRFHVAGAELAWQVAKRAPSRIISVATTTDAQIAAMTAYEALFAECH